MYDVYVKTDDAGRIIAVNSSAFIQDFSLWTLLASNVSGDRGHHAQGNYFSLPIRTSEGVCRYKLAAGIALARTSEEIHADIDALPQKTPDPIVEIKELIIELAHQNAILADLIRGMITVDPV